MRDHFRESHRARDVKERFEAQKHCKIAVDSQAATHGKEYHFVLSWSIDGQKRINNKLDYYDGKLYFFDQGYLFSSNEDGSELRVLLKVGQHFQTDKAVNVDESNIFLAVNGGGIYLYQHGERLQLCHFTLEGQLVKTFYIPGDIYHVYIVENRVYYAKSDDGEKAYYFDCTTEKEIFLMEATQILELYGDQDKAVLHGGFERQDGESTLYDEGWYLYRFATGEWECLSSRNCPPHYVITKPECYRPGHPDYIDFKDVVEIRAVNLVHNLMWVVTPLSEKTDNGITTQEYWEPFTLEGHGTPILDAPIWRLGTQQFIPSSKRHQVVGSSYFDGTCFLSGRSIYYMKSYTVEGIREIYGENDNRGACHNFRVLNGYVYADFCGKGWEQHKIEGSELTFVRRCGFGAVTKPTDLVRDLILDFQG